MWVNTWHNFLSVTNECSLRMCLISQENMCMVIAMLQTRNYIENSCVLKNYGIDILHQFQQSYSMTVISLNAVALCNMTFGLYLERGPSINSTSHIIRAYSVTKITILIWKFHCLCHPVVSSRWLGITTRRYSSNEHIICIDLKCPSGVPFSLRFLVI
jgi:hypothetical protein